MESTKPTPMFLDLTPEDQQHPLADEARHVLYLWDTNAEMVSGRHYVGGMSSDSEVSRLWTLDSPGDETDPWILVGSVDGQTVVEFTLQVLPAYRMTLSLAPWVPGRDNTEKDRYQAAATQALQEIERCLAMPNGLQEWRDTWNETPGPSMEGVGEGLLPFIDWNLYDAEELDGPEPGMKLTLDGYGVRRDHDRPEDPEARTTDLGEDLVSYEVEVDFVLREEAGRLRRAARTQDLLDTETPVTVQ